jgi:multiple antibiotic resistance protein
MHWSDIAAAAATLFFVMDPLGNIPVFNAVLMRFTPRRRAQITARELAIALAILLLLLFAGTAILDFLGLSQPSLNIAGGVLLFIIALRMIFPHLAGEVASEKDGPFIVPLAMPMVAGPSTIAMGDRGLRALERLMGMLLVLLATQMLLNGVREFVQSLAV